MSSAPRDKSLAEEVTLAEVLRAADDDALVRTNFGQIVATYEETARAILASGWLTAHDERVRAATRGVTQRGGGEYDPTGGDGFVRGDWRHIEAALLAGLITDDEYEYLARRPLPNGGER